MRHVCFISKRMPFLVILHPSSMFASRRHAAETSLHTATLGEFKLSNPPRLGVSFRSLLLIGKWKLKITIIQRLSKSCTKRAPVHMSKSASQGDAFEDDSKKGEKSDDCHWETKPSFDKASLPTSSELKRNTLPVKERPFQKAAQLPAS